MPTEGLGYYVVSSYSRLGFASNRAAPSKFEVQGDSVVEPFQPSGLECVSIAQAMGQNNMKRIDPSYTDVWDLPVGCAGTAIAFPPYSATGFAPMAIFADKMAEQFMDEKLGASVAILLMIPYDYLF